MRTEKEMFSIVSAHDGLQLAGMMVRPASAPVGIVQFCHGMAEPKERYEGFMTWLAEQGYIAAIIDHRGHGASVRSEEDLGYFQKNGADGVVEDAHQVTSWLKAHFPELPLFLFGHSMGSLIVRVYLKKYDRDLAGLIVCGSPSANPAAPLAVLLSCSVGLFKGERYRSPFLTSLTTGSYAKGLEPGSSPNAWISYNKENVAKYDADPHCGFPFTANGYEALTRLLSRCYSRRGWHVTRPSLPVLFISGCDDPCLVNKDQFDRAVAFLTEMGYKNVTSHLYPGMRHEILNEDDHMIVYEDVLKFIRSAASEGAEVPAR